MHVSINVGSLFDSSLKDNGRGRSFQWVELQAVHLQEEMASHVIIY